MSTTLLYHAWGGRGYRLAATRFESGRVCFHIEYLQNPHTPLRCAHCGSTRTERAGKVPRSFRTLPVGSRPVVLELPIQRLRCFECGRTAQVRLGFADPRRGYTRAFERYVLELSRFMTVQDVARHLQVSWDIVRDIQKRHLLRRFSRPKLKHLKHIAIDEISIGKGHRYLTVVLDHRTELLNWYRCPISTGPLEGTNTKIKLMQRQAYGYRDMEFFRLKIYALHKTTYALVG